MFRYFGPYKLNHLMKLYTITIEGNSKIIFHWKFWDCWFLLAKCIEWKKIGPWWQNVLKRKKHLWTLILYQIVTKTEFNHKYHIWSGLYILVKNKQSPAPLKISIGFIVFLFYNKPFVGHWKLRWIGTSLVLWTNKLSISCHNKERKCRQHNLSAW